MINTATMISVVIPQWNRKKEVLKLLGQLRHANHTNLKIIVVDNGSTDDSYYAIRKNFPEVVLLRNKKNLGGTKGFNIGIKYALEHHQPEYIWLLDSDAEITKNSLPKLVEICNCDKNIGIAGSLIKDINNRNIIVEAGATIDTLTLTPHPFFRNSETLPTKKVIETDYVAICSALVRVSALKKVGLMDERYFVFWDDIDWGYKFKSKGFKVVCATESIVYHPSFTERDRGDIINYYYGVRNRLLFCSKYISLFNRCAFLYLLSKQLWKLFFFLKMSGEGYKCTLIYSAIKHFLTNEWYECEIPHSVNNNSYCENELCHVQISSKKVLVLLGDDYSTNVAFLRKLNELNPSSLCVLARSDRFNLYRDFCDYFIGYESRDLYSVPKLITLLFKLLRLRSDIFISLEYSPFSIVSNKYYLFNYKKGKFCYKGRWLGRVLILVLSFICGEIVGSIAYPLVFVASCVYHHGLNNFNSSFPQIDVSP